MSAQQIKIVVVNSYTDQTEQNGRKQQQLIDPLIQELSSLKITENLVKQVNFNSTVNKFEYLEQILKKQYQNFHQNINKLESKQKQVLIKNIKRLHKQIQKLGYQILRPKQPLFSNSLVNNPQQLFDLSRKIDTTIQIQKDSVKYLKLSQGMLNVVQKIEFQLDEVAKRKLEAIKANSNEKNKN